MIVPMMKYSFLLYHLDYQEFLTRLQAIGLVDVSVRDWTPSEQERALILTIDKYAAAHKHLAELAVEKHHEIESEKPFSSADETMEQYYKASEAIESIKMLITRTENEADALRPWGEFDAQRIEQLRIDGVELRFFQCYTKEYNNNIEEWSSKYTISKINETVGVTYFSIISHGDSEIIDITAQESKMFSANFLEKEQELIHLESLMKSHKHTLLRCAKGYKALKPMEERLKSDLKLSKVMGGGDREAEGTIVIMEGWATKETETKVDEFLTVEESVISIKDRPTPDDNPPVLLRNNKFSRLFEVVGNLYSLPNYHSMDLTPYFAPFFMIFFGFCLGDAGYGVLFVLAAFIVRFKMPKAKPLANLVIFLGIATVVFGMLTGTVFGISLAEVPALVEFKNMFISQNQMFEVALYAGVLQILYAMGVKAYGRIKRYGFMYGVSTIGWMVVIISGGLAMGFPAPITGYDMSSPIFIALLTIGLVAMLFMNNPKKSIFMNFGLGLWDMYNAITGFLGDMLSYIRLFALGLCSGIIASVFNSLAVGLSPDIPVVGIIVTVLILVIGHSINIFMSTLGSFVHPLRLTFVEFYKNAGFEDGGRAFEPLKKNDGL